MSPPRPPPRESRRVLRALPHSILRISNWSGPSFTENELKHREVDNLPKGTQLGRAGLSGAQVASPQNHSVNCKKKQNSSHS